MHVMAVFGAPEAAIFSCGVMISMLQIQHLSIRHARDLRPLLCDFSFTLRKGDKAVIVGEEGNGKSTLLQLIYDPALVEGYAEWQGNIVTQGARLGYLRQELTPGEKALSAYEYLSARPGFFDLSPRDLSGIAHSLMLPVDLFYSEQRVGSLSGGEKVKLQLCGLMIEKPDILLLDEPSGDLDLSTLGWLQRFINASSAPVLFVSHDETLIEETANVVIHLELLRRRTLPRATVARMPYRQYYEERLAALAHQEQMARKEAAEFQAKKEKYLQIESRVEHAQKVITRADPAGGRLLKKKMHAVKSLGRRLEKEKEQMTQLPDLEDPILLFFPEEAAFPAGKVLLDYSLPELRAPDGRLLSRNVRLSVRGPEKIGIVGKNGAGKSTLIRKIAAELSGRGDLALSYMPQNYEEQLDMDETPVRFLAQTGAKEESTRIRTLLGSLRYTPEEMEHPISALSGGQKAKLFFLRMILSGSSVLVLDEPTRNFSPLSGPEIRRVLREFGGAILCVTHDRKLMREVCDKVYELTEAGLSRLELTEDDGGK